MILVEEEEEGDNDSGVEYRDEPVEVSLNSVVGLSNPKTMKLIGKIADKEVVVMIDPGATHNFVSLKAVEELAIPVAASGGFGVSLGNGDAVEGSGMCKGVSLTLAGGVKVEEDFLPLNLGNSDVILGVQWLEKLGPVTTNWKSQVMRFQLNGREIILQEDPSLARSRISLKAIIRTVRREGGGVLLEMNVGEVLWAFQIRTHTA